MDNIQTLIDKVKDDSFFSSVSGVYSLLPYADTIPLEIYRRIQSEQARKNVTTRLIENHKLKNNVIALGTYTRCICAETGITFAVALPSPLDTTFTMLHPFAFHANVMLFIKTYQRNGIPLSGIESQALAGMLITILKHKGYSVCRDYVAANLRLRQVNKKSLTWALAYFYRAFPRQNLPQFNLLAEGNPTTQLIGFIQICRGEDNSIEAHHMVEKKQATIKAKIYQTDEAKEGAALRNDIKSCLDLLERLIKDRPDISKELNTSFEQRIRKLAIYNEMAKENLVTDIIGCYGDNTQTKAITIIIKSNDMTATQKEAFTWSMEVAREIEGFKTDKAKATKLDFAALMGKDKVT